MVGLHVCFKNKLGLHSQLAVMLQLSSRHAPASNAADITLVVCHLGCSISLVPEASL
jgi:hypothetical protein